ncbi:BadF/BadG/BcrA/BcrD ATPase family protein [Cohnella faecalis]|uniref:N-acetylglucosamine kinase n=1 Tax=Cohnella faecalis TaxID=2315694 RepID=A0A398CJ77_9BACL|nr:BadF/BadG/BcrA/BcrD ATPase family protein [Cohnella faecalis]RIE01279.1 N-acetylglucosamine kinase [Cohnella faecalis]
MRLSNQRFIGLDGGGSKTYCVIGDGEGRLTFLSRGSSSNMKSKPWTEVRKVLSESIMECWDNGREEESELNTVFLGMAGSDRPEDRERIGCFLEELLPSNREFVVRSDALSAMASGTWGEPGIILIAGTGSIATSYNPATDEYHRVGGWGYVLGDEGSGYQIGRSGLISMLHQFDGRGPYTAITEKVLRQWKMDNASQLITYVYENEELRKTVAEAARAVLDSAAEGDQVANRIIDEAIGELILLVETLAGKGSRREERSPLVIAGGLFDSETFFSRFRERAAERLAGFDPVRPEFPPVIGSYILALRRADIAITLQVRQRLAESWNALRGQIKE